MRGPEKVLVALLLVVSAAATAALAGFAAGVAWAVVGLPSLTPAILAAVVGAALMADLLFARTGRPRPWSVGRQVPREWSELFAPPLVATLYGARLGVGPLTILPSWLWWAVLVAGAALGPGWSAGTGAAFAVARLAVVLGVAEVARRAMAVRMARVRAGEPVARAVCTLAALALVAHAVVRG